MGNDVFVQSCKFVDYKGDEEQAPSYGFRVFDDEGKDYCNGFAEDVWQELRDKGAEDILKFFINFGSSEGIAIAEFALWIKKWVYFDGKYTQLPGFEEKMAEIKATKDEEEIT
jgi:hypothetical protein